MSDKLRDQKNPRVLGYRLDKKTLTPLRENIDLNTLCDYGSDPLGEIDGVFKWKMIPSGDIVELEERNRRLCQKK